MIERTWSVMVKNKKTYVILFLAVVFYSMVSVFSKKASAFETVFSWGFVFNYGIALAILAVYAVIWQYVLTKLPLSVAYMYKGYSYLFTIIWAVTIFGEKLSWRQILGTVIIIIGVMISQGGNAEEGAEGKHE